MTTNDLEIYSVRVLNAPPEKVYRAFADPTHLAIWWGPEGFTNTFHVFDLRLGGAWKLTMHGPDKGNYENEAVFTEIVAGRKIRWKRLTQPYFDMELQFEPFPGEQTRFSFRMLFESADTCAKVKPYAIPKNEENFDRLERVLEGMVK